MLNTFTKPINPDKLLWDIHFWIGSESTQDEYGTAAYKTVELDDKLGGHAVQHREVESSETELFLSYFFSLQYLSGGAASGFKHVEEEKVAPQLFEVKGHAANLRLKQVELSRDSMNSGDVYILVTKDMIWQWNGSGSNAHERSKAAEMCRLIGSEQGGTKVTVLQEDSSQSEAAAFWDVISIVGSILSALFVLLAYLEVAEHWNGESAGIARGTEVDGHQSVGHQGEDGAKRW